jgi:hypothetical protein
MRVNGGIRVWMGAAWLLSAALLGGCSVPIADMPLIGTPADAPNRPKDPPPWLPVHDMPPDRSDVVMDPAERAKVQSELIAARDRQAATAATDAAAVAKNPVGK